MASAPTQSRKSVWPLIAEVWASSSAAVAATTLSRVLIRFRALVRFRCSDLICLVCALSVFVADHETVGTVISSATASSGATSRRMTAPSMGVARDATQGQLKMQYRRLDIGRTTSGPELVVSTVAGSTSP